MDAQEIRQVITEAQRFSALGLYSQAWDIIESLPPSEGVTSAAIAVRLLVFAGLERWEIGEEIARLIDSTHPLFEREAAGRFHLAYAEHSFRRW